MPSPAWCGFPTCLIVSRRTLSTIPSVHPSKSPSLLGFFTFSIRPAFFGWTVEKCQKYPILLGSDGWTVVIPPGETMAELAREYECGEATIWRAVH
jgi:hypothetical protein